MKAHPSIRNTYWLCADWYFYVDSEGDVHTSFSRPWHKRHLNKPGQCPHNHWLKGGGLWIGPGGHLLNPSLENK